MMKKLNDMVKKKSQSPDIKVDDQKEVREEVKNDSIIIDDEGSIDIDPAIIKPVIKPIVLKRHKTRKG